MRRMKERQCIRKQTKKKQSTILDGRIANKPTISRISHPSAALQWACELAFAHHSSRMHSVLDRNNTTPLLLECRSSRHQITVFRARKLHVGEVNGCVRFDTCCGPLTRCVAKDLVACSLDVYRTYIASNSAHHQVALDDILAERTLSKRKRLTRVEAQENRSHLLLTRCFALLKRLILFFVSTNLIQVVIIRFRFSHVGANFLQCITSTNHQQ